MAGRRDTRFRCQTHVPLMASFHAPVSGCVWYFKSPNLAQHGATRILCPAVAGTVGCSLRRAKATSSVSLAPSISQSGLRELAI
jgi:hypothetical protein